MKILYICNEYPPFVHGGIGTFTRDLAEIMHLDGNEVCVWGLYSNLKEKECVKINGVKVIREKGVRYNSKINSIIYRLQLYYKLRVFLRVHKFDIIECQEYLGFLPFGLNHKGFIIRLHGAAVFFNHILKRNGSRLTHWYEKQMIKKSQHIIAVSKYCGESTLKICDLEQKKYKVIYNSVDVKKINVFKSIYKSNYKIVFANTVNRKKGVFELVTAFNKIASKFPEAKLFIIGKLNYSENGVNIKDLLLDKVNEKYRSRLFITGWLNSEQEVYNHLADSHVCVYPSHMEGFGIAPVEPMTLGKPVLFMKNGPGPEVIEDGVSGLLIDSFSPSDIAEKIELLFLNPNLVNKLSKNAQLRVKNKFQKDTVFLDNNKKFYDSVLIDFKK